MTRRDAIKLAAVAPAIAGTSASALAAQSGKLRMGGTSTAFAIRSRSLRQAKQPWDQLEHCRSLGMGGTETRPPSFEPAAIKEFRKKIESYDMYLVADGLRLPNSPADLPAFEQAVRGFVEAGAVATRSPQTQRRYEQYKTLEEYKTDWARCRRQVELAEPIARKYKLKIGIENHKGQRFEEFLNWIKGVGSEWIGITFDIGNNYSLCDDPEEWLDKLAPYCVNVHIKDMALGEYSDGFLLSEVVLGQGILDLKRFVQVLRKANPTIPIGLEMITRDPLQIPVFTDQYWATFDTSSPLPGRDLAHILKLVKTKGTKELPRISHLSPADQLKAEDENNKACVAWARANLGL